MSKKITGFKNKTLARVTAGVVTTGIFVGSIIGINIHKNATYRPDVEKDKYPYESGQVERPAHTLAPEPGIQTEPSIKTEFDTAPTDTRPLYSQSEPSPSPETEPPFVSAPDINVESPANSDYVDVLANLTNLFKNRMYLITNHTPDLTATSINSIQLNEEMIEIHGELYLGDTLNSYIATVGSTRDFYYHLNDNFEEKSFASALNQLLQTTDAQDMKLQLKNNFKFASEGRIVQNILSLRLNELKLTGGNQKEIRDLQNAIKNPSNVQLSILRDTYQKTGDGQYLYSFNTEINTGAYVYYSTHQFTSTKQLKSTELKEKVEDCLLNNLANSTIYSNPSSIIDEEIYNINSTADLKQDNSFNK